MKRLLFLIIAVPLLLMSQDFEAQGTTEAIELTWTTPFEIGNLGFTITRDHKMIASYTNDDRLAGRGTHLGTTVYNYADTNAIPGRSYVYRLIQHGLYGNDKEIGSAKGIMKKKQIKPFKKKGRDK